MQSASARYPANLKDPSHPATTALAQLLEVALELSSTHDVDDILRVATSGVCQAVGCDRASLFLYDEPRQELRTRVVTELEIAEIRHPVDRGIAGWVARHQQLLSVPTPALDERWDGSIDRQTGFRTQNILAAPIVGTEGHLLGVLQLLNKQAGFGSLDEQLVQAFAAHVAVALDRQRLEQSARQAWELRQSLEVGHRIQARFLPSSLPTIPGYDVASWWQPAEFVSGDYYDWLPLKDGRWGFAVGDVSGHGMGAALLMATVRAMAHVLSRTATDVPEFVETLRASITPDLGDSRFITCCYAVLDPKENWLIWANAGHAPALWYDSRAGNCQQLMTTTVPLGFPAVVPLRPVEPITLAPGDCLILATDGVVEVRNAADEMYGSRRLAGLVCQQPPDATAMEIVAAISQDVGHFHGQAAPQDDMTLVVVKRMS